MHRNNFCVSDFRKTEKSKLYKCKTIVIALTQDKNTKFRN